MGNGFSGRFGACRGGKALSLRAVPGRMVRLGECAATLAATMGGLSQERGGLVPPEGRRRRCWRRGGSILCKRPPQCSRQIRTRALAPLLGPWCRARPQGLGRKASPAQPKTQPWPIAHAREQCRRATTAARQASAAGSRWRAAFVGHPGPPRPAVEAWPGAGITQAAGARALTQT